MTPAVAALIRERRFGVAGTYGLTVAENLCMLAYPTLTGQAVDQLLQRRYEGLAWLVGVWLLHLLLSFTRG